MTIENLQVFEILVQELNFTRAARRANMSQTTLSRKISAIEDELQVRLFQRDRHSVQLTNAGREFYVRITPILQEYRLSVMQAQNVQRGVVGTVQVGFGVYEHILLRPVIGRFLNENSVARVNCLQFKYRELLDEFMNDHIDLIVTSDQFINTVPRDELEMVLLHDHPWVIAMSRNDPLAAEEAVNIRNMHEARIITMHEGSIGMVRSGFMGQVAFRSCDYVNSYEAKMMLIAAGRGVGFIPRFVDVSYYPEIVTREIAPLFRPRRYYAVYKHGNTNPYTQILCGLLGEYYGRSLWMPKVVY